MNIKLFYEVFFDNANIKLAESTDRWLVMHRYRHANIRWTFIFINLAELSRHTQASLCAQHNILGSMCNWLSLIISWLVPTNSNRWSIMKLQPTPITICKPLINTRTLRLCMYASSTLPFIAVCNRFSRRCFDQCFRSFRSLFESIWIDYTGAKLSCIWKFYLLPFLSFYLLTFLSFYLLTFLSFYLLTFLAYVSFDTEFWLIFNF